MEGLLGLDLVSTGLKTMAMLFIVLGLLVLLLYFMKKYISPKGRSKGDLFIKVLSSHYLSPKERVEVIEISGERIVLGVTPGSINFLTKLNDLNEGGREKIGTEKDVNIKG
jgi:flagellar biosynthetic protein FliO